MSKTSKTLGAIVVSNGYIQNSMPGCKCTSFWILMETLGTIQVCRGHYIRLGLQKDLNPRSSGQHSTTSY